MDAQDKKNKAVAFINEYYSNKHEKRPRKSFKRLCDAIKQTSGSPCYDNETMEALYVNLTGEKPYCDFGSNKTEEWYEDMRFAAYKIINHLTDEPTSLSDIFRSHNTDMYPRYRDTRAMPARYDSIRKCFKTMADRGIIGCVSIRTCGRVYLNLYYLND